MISAGPPLRLSVYPRLAKRFGVRVKGFDDSFPHLDVGPSVLIYPPNASSTPEQGVSLARCPKCGALTPRNAASCVHCGTPFGQRTDVPAPRVARVPTVPERDEVVYRYVVERRGEISLSRASTDLHMTTSELQAAIRRLEDSGKISREGLGGS